MGTVKVTVRCYGPARQAAGSETVELRLEEPVTVAAVLDALAGTGAALAAIIPSCAVAVGDEFVGPSEELLAASAHDVALLPPVAGG